MDRFAAVLAKTYVYQPNHEGISDHDPWQVRIQISGERAQTLDLVVGNGNSSNPNAAWVEMGTRAAYQNLSLAHFLNEELSPGLWSESTQAEAAPSG